MKKLITLAASVLLFIDFTANADAAIKPAQIKDGVKSYSAVLTKNTKVFNRAHYMNTTETLKKGTRVTIVERIDYKKYHYFVLKGQKYMKVSNNLTNIKSVNGKTNYHQFKLSSFAKKELSKLGSNHRDYNAYKRAVTAYELNEHQIDMIFIDLILRQEFYNENIPAIGYEGEQPYTYQYWKSIGKPVPKKVSTKNWINQ